MSITNGGPAEAVTQSGRPLMETRWGRLISSVACAAMLVGTAPAPLFAQAPPPPQQGQQQQGYAPEQLDAILAPIALYPDQLLTQVLMASAYPDQVQAAASWVGNPANAQLRGDQLTAALTPLPWDPSVKSLIPFPQVLTMMTQQPDWLQQLGYAMSVQQPDVMASVQRLRQQAQIAGQLQSSEHQVVRTEGSAIVIQPAQPDVVYVPSYNPVTVYGAWPYPSYPPYYLPPPPGYYAGAALVGGLAFGVGVAIGVGAFGGLWGWARPNWGGGNVFVNVNVYNRWSPNRPWNGNGNYWHPYRPVARPNWGYRPPAAAFHPPGGYRPAGYRPPVNGGFRPPPAGFHPPAGGFHPPPGGYHPGGPTNGLRPPPPAGINRPAAGVRPGGVPATRPAAPVTRPATPGTRPGTRPEGATRPANRPAAPTRQATRPASPEMGHRTQAAQRPAAPEMGHRTQDFRPPSAAARPAAPRPAPRPAPAPRPQGGGGHPGGGGERKHG